MLDAMQLDKEDAFKPLTDLFDMPVDANGNKMVYLNGNSLGPKLKSVNEVLLKQCDAWGKLGVRGHFDGSEPWVSYHQHLSPLLARLVGAKRHEVVAMGTLTGNLHLAFMSFYRPTPKRYKVIHFAGFPSDTYAIRSQVALRLQTISDFNSKSPFSLEDVVVAINPEENGYIAFDKIDAVLAEHGNETAVVWFEAVHYLTGQCFDIQRITALAHRYGCKVGFDLAHAIGNVELTLHDHKVDFAVWCHYKYLSAGAGAIAGLYIHEQYGKDPNYPRLTGWWGNRAESRFDMSSNFDPILGAEGWLLSNPEIFSLKVLQETLSLFDRVDLTALRAKNRRLVGYMEALIQHKLGDKIQIITPINPEERGCQLSLRAKGITDLALVERRLLQSRVVCDLRQELIRVAPMGLYNTYQDVFYFVEQLQQYFLENKG